MTGPGYRYRAWGWDMLVPMPVPELLQARTSGRLDWQLQLGAPADGAEALRFVLPNGTPAALLSRDLACVAADHRSPQDLHPSLMRAVLAVALRHAGRVVLHAAAVELRGRVLVILGASGAGKTTLAATLCAMGGRLLGDELCALAWRDGHPVVLPGSTLLALAPEAIVLAGLEQPEKAVVRHGRVLTPVPGCRDVLPPDAICLLDWAAEGEVEVTSLAPPSAFQALIAARYQPGIGPHSVNAVELPRIARLAAACPTWRVTRARGVPPVEVARAILRSVSQR